MPIVPDVEVSEPVICGSISLFPLFTRSESRLEYQLSEEAISSGIVSVEEVTEAGSVPEVTVVNQSDTRVLFVEGEELIGAKQNRILNTSLFVPAKSSTMVPVSCVEQGRWAYKARKFGSSRAMSSSSLRRLLKRSVSSSLNSGRGYRSDQAAVWHEIARQHKELEVESPTQAMFDTYRSYETEIARIQNELRYIDQAAGLAVAIGARGLTIDLFDKQSTCQKLWNRIVAGCALEADASISSRPDRSDISNILQELKHGTWTQSHPIGEGEHFRRQLTLDVKTLATALELNGWVVHLGISSLA